MPRSGGTYTPPTNSWSPAINGTLATTADWQALLNDIVAALTQSVSKDGQTVMTGSLNMGGFNLSNVASAAITALTGSPTIDAPTLTGVPLAPTAAPGTSTTQIATTAFVAASFAPIASPTLTGTPAAPTAAPGTNSTQIATTGFVAASFAPINSPTFTGTVTIPSGASIDGFAPINSPALTGTPTAPTATVGTNNTQVATTAFVNATALSASLPGQTGQDGNFIRTDGTSANWASIYGTPQVINTNTNAVNGGTYVLTASLTLTLPATPTAGNWVVVQNSSGTATAVIGRNGSNIMSLAENLTIDSDFVSVRLVYADATRGWVFG